MKRITSLLVLPAAVAVLAQVASAGPIVYQNDFNVHANVRPGSPVSDNNWNAYVTASDTSVVDATDLAPVLGGDQWAGTTHGNAAANTYLFAAPGTAGSTDAGVESLLFSDDLGSTVSLAELESISVKQRFDGSAADSAEGRFTIKIGSTWYASLYNWTTTAQTTAFIDESVSGIDFTDGNNWLALTATAGGVGTGEITLGSAVGGTLTGDISSFGVYAEHGNAGDHIRIDDYSVTIPEPATMGLVALFGGSVLFIRRRFMI